MLYILYLNFELFIDTKINCLKSPIYLSANKDVALIVTSAENLNVATAFGLSLRLDKAARVATGLPGSFGSTKKL